MSHSAENDARLCCVHCRTHDGPHDPDDHQEPCEWCACTYCGHQHTSDGCVGDPTPSDLWAGVTPSVCDCDRTFSPEPTTHVRQTYEPCVTDANGNCTRWSHDHSRVLPPAEKGGE